MTRCLRIIIPAVCITIALTTGAFGQVRKYTESFDRDRQVDSKIVESLDDLKAFHSRLKTNELLKKLNDWGASQASLPSIGPTASALSRATFKLKEDAIVMKVFWDEDVEGKSKEWIEAEGMNHCFRIANDIMSEWNKDRSCQLVRFAGLQLLALPLDQKQGRLTDED